MAQIKQIVDDHNRQKNIPIKLNAVKQPSQSFLTPYKLPESTINDAEMQASFKRVDQQLRQGANLI